MVLKAIFGMWFGAAAIFAPGLLGSSPSAGAAALATRAPMSLGVPAAATLCRRTPNTAYGVPVSGFLVMEGGPAYRFGGLFATDELPADVAAGGVERFGGIGVIIPLRRTQQGGHPVIPPTARVSPPLGPRWVVVQGVLSCRHGVAGIEMHAWRGAVRPTLAAIPTIAGVLTVRQARSLCERDPRGRYRVYVRGTFTAVPNGDLDSGVLDSRALRPLPVIASAAQVPAPIPSDREVTAHGLLACTQSPPLLEVYSWHPSGVS